MTTTIRDNIGGYIPPRSIPAYYAFSYTVYPKKHHCSIEAAISWCREHCGKSNDPTAYYQINAYTHESSHFAYNGEFIRVRYVNFVRFARLEDATAFMEVMDADWVRIKRPEFQIDGLTRGQRAAAARREREAMLAPEEIARRRKAAAEKAKETRRWREQMMSPGELAAKRRAAVEKARATRAANQKEVPEGVRRQPRREFPMVTSILINNCRVQFKQPVRLPEVMKAPIPVPAKIGLLEQLVRERRLSRSTKAAFHAHLTRQEGRR